MAAPSILIVEDEFLIRMTLSEALADEGYEVHEAGSADEGLAKLHEQPGIGLLMTDVQLPGGMDGLELARIAREQQPALPIIYVSGRPDVLGGAAKTSQDVLLPKPYLPSDVIRAVERLIGPAA